MTTTGWIIMGSIIGGVVLVAALVVGSCLCCGPRSCDGFPCCCCCCSCSNICDCLSFLCCWCSRCSCCSSQATAPSPAAMGPTPPAAVLTTVTVVSDEARAVRIYETLALTVPATPRPIDKCRSGHDLVLIKNDTNRFLGRNAWQRCNCCGKTFMFRDGSWRCVACDFDVCPQCRTAAPHAELKYPACKRGHFLVWSVYYGMYRNLPYNNKMYKCESCLQQKSCEQGRWFCVYCMLDVCAECQKKSAVPPSAPVAPLPTVYPVPTVVPPAPAQTFVSTVVSAIVPTVAPTSVPANVPTNVPTVVQPTAAASLATSGTATPVMMNDSSEMQSYRAVSTCTEMRTDRKESEKVREKMGEKVDGLPPPPPPPAPKL